jgi:hypothetical protein
MRKMMRAAVAPVLLLAAAGCNDLLGGDLGGSDVQQQELERARALWTTGAPASYQYRIELACTCLDQIESEEAYIQVSGGTITVDPLGRDDAVAIAAFERFGTVARLFAEVEEAVQRPSTQFHWRRVTYNGELGYPEFADMFYRDGDQFIFRISEVEPVE